MRPSGSSRIVSRKPALSPRPLPCCCIRSPALALAGKLGQEAPSAKSVGAVQLVLRDAIAARGGTPRSFECTISLDMMMDPTVAADGYTYERSAIVAWLEGHGTSPITGEPMEKSVLIPNRDMRSRIQEFMQQCRDAGR